jgi:cell division protein FtsI (penicillin-binding protein 3)
VIDGPKLLAEMAKSDDPYVYLARGLMPAQADDVMTQIRKVIDEGNVDAVVEEVQQLRNYPAGAAAKSVVGSTNTWDGKGQLGIESRFEKTLSGTAGSMVVDVYKGGNIPGSQRDLISPVNGSDVTLTLDFDLQFTVDNMLATYVDRVGARGGMALVEDVQTGQIYAISTYQPHATDAEKLYNLAVGGPFEPGSVNKVVTFAAALDAGIITPTSTYLVDGSVKKGGATIHDAWGHGPITMTATGILAKSSNVGTLAIAEQVGRDTFAEYLKRFGLGQKTGIELGGESAGLVLDQSLWSATSFANMPIGQGLSMTLVQLASMYQAIGNGGVRVTPTLLKSTSTGVVTTPNPVAPGVQVMKPETADTLLAMLRATTQTGTGPGDIGHRGTAPGAQLNGYQVAGKTGTAQQVDQACKCYSDGLYNSTFAGVFPADNPRFVIAIMLDAPTYPNNAVPLFHDIAAYTARKFDVPNSATPAPLYDLYVGKY